MAQGVMSIMNDPEPSIRLTPAMLDKIEEEQPLSLLNHTDAWFNWPAIKL